MSNHAQTVSGLNLVSGLGHQIDLAYRPWWLGIFSVIRRLEIAVVLDGWPTSPHWWSYKGNRSPKSSCRINHSETDTLSSWTHSETDTSCKELEQCGSVTLSSWTTMSSVFLWNKRTTKVTSFRLKFWRKMMLVKTAHYIVLCCGVLFFLATKKGWGGGNEA